MKLCVPRTIKMAKEAASCKRPGSRGWGGAAKKRKGKREESAANMMMTAKSYSLEPEREKKPQARKENSQGKLAAKE